MLSSSFMLNAAFALIKIWTSVQTFLCGDSLQHSTYPWNLASIWTHSGSACSVVLSFLIVLCRAYLTDFLIRSLQHGIISHMHSKNNPGGRCFNSIRTKITHTSLIACISNIYCCLAFCTDTCVKVDPCRSFEECFWNPNFLGLFFHLLVEVIQLYIVAVILFCQQSFRNYIKK